MEPSFIRYRPRWPFIANPDLVDHLKTGALLAEIDWETVYASGAHGYSDYSALNRTIA